MLAEDDSRRVNDSKRLLLPDKHRNAHSKMRLGRESPADAQRVTDLVAALKPEYVSPLVAWLATEKCPASGKVFFIQGGVIRLFQNWTMTETLEKGDRFTIDELEAGLPKLLQ